MSPDRSTSTTVGTCFTRRARTSTPTSCVAPRPSASANATSAGATGALDTKRTATPDAAASCTSLVRNGTELRHTAHVLLAKSTIVKGDERYTSGGTSMRLRVAYAGLGPSPTASRQPGRARTIAVTATSARLATAAETEIG